MQVFHLGCKILFLSRVRPDMNEGDAAAMIHNLFIVIYSLIFR